MFKLILVAASLLTAACAQVTTPARVVEDLGAAYGREAKRPVEYYQISCNSFYARRATLTLNGMHTAQITTSHPMRLFDSEPSTTFVLSANNQTNRKVVFKCANMAAVVNVTIRY